MTTTFLHRTFSAMMLLGLIGCQRPSLQSALDSLASDSIAKRGLVGVGISVRLEDGRLFQSDAGSTAPSSASAYSVTGTRQILGSVTKLYVATLIMQLVERGELSLDDTIDAWVDVPAAERITVRMLLDHTSGLADCLARMSPDDRKRSWTPQDLIDRAVALGAVAEPPSLPTCVRHRAARNLV